MSNAKKRGNAWEERIALECVGLELEKAALIHQAPDAFKILGTNHDGSPRVVRQRKSQPDFYGLCDGGRHVSFDAKRTGNKRRFSLPDPRKPTEKWWHQIDKLTKAARFGAITFLYLLADDDDPFKGRRFVLPVVDYHVAGRDPRLDRSLKLNDLEAYRVQHRTDTWLDVVVHNLDWWDL